MRTLWRNRRLMRSMVRRDILARYRGSFAGAVWTFLNPLLLMATYFFVFGVVMQSHIGADRSRSGLILYFLAGMMPWVAVRRGGGRSPAGVSEQPKFCKKPGFSLGKRAGQPVDFGR